jgi:hypothetical protein
MGLSACRAWHDLGHGPSHTARDLSGEANELEELGIAKCVEAAGDAPHFLRQFDRVQVCALQIKPASTQPLSWAVLAPVKAKEPE